MGVRSSASTTESSVSHSPQLSLGLHSYGPGLGRESKWKRILKIPGSQENSHSGHEADSWVLLQPILPMGLEQPQTSFTLESLDLALSALIPVATCTWIPRP